VPVLLLCISIKAKCYKCCEHLCNVCSFLKLIQYVFEAYKITGKMFLSSSIFCKVECMIIISRCVPKEKVSKAMFLIYCVYPSSQTTRLILFKLYIVDLHQILLGQFDFTLIRFILRAVLL
jgi:hypothetical protein